MKFKKLNGENHSHFEEMQDISEVLLLWNLTQQKIKVWERKKTTEYAKHLNKVAK